MKVKPLLEGKPFMTEYGIVGYSTVVLIACDDEKNILYDCGSKGCVLQLKEALEKAGMKPEDITHVVISHLHFDHVGNLPLFSDAEILLNKIEWESANQTPDEWHSIQTLAYVEKGGNLLRGGVCHGIAGTHTGAYRSALWSGDDFMLGCHEKPL